MFCQYLILWLFIWKGDHQTNERTNERIANRSALPPLKSSVKETCTHAFNWKTKKSRKINNKKRGTERRRSFTTWLNVNELFSHFSFISVDWLAAFKVQKPMIIILDFLNAARESGAKNRRKENKRQRRRRRNWIHTDCLRGKCVIGSAYARTHTPSENEYVTFIWWKWYTHMEAEWAQTTAA